MTERYANSVNPPCRAWESLDGSPRAYCRLEVGHQGMHQYVLVLDSLVAELRDWWAHRPDVMDSTFGLYKLAAQAADEIEALWRQPQTSRVKHARRDAREAHERANALAAEVERLRAVAVQNSVNARNLLVANQPGVLKVLDATAVIPTGVVESAIEDRGGTPEQWARHFGRKLTYGNTVAHFARRIDDMHTALCGRPGGYYDNPDDPKPICEACLRRVRR